MSYQTERTYPLTQKKFNPITHRILRFCQLWKGGRVLFGMDLENMVTVNELIWTLVLIIIICQVIGLSTFRDMTSHKFSFQNSTNHCNSIFSPWNRAKLEKKYFLCLKTSFLSQIYTALCISTVLEQNKKLICSNFWDISFQKQLQQLRLVNRFC